jgi:hypothetical protein
LVSSPKGFFVKCDVPKWSDVNAAVAETVAPSANLIFALVAAARSLAGADLTLSSVRCYASDV